MFHSKVSTDADNKALNLYQAFIVSKTRTGHGTTDWFQIEKKEYVKAIYCHSAYLTYMQGTS